MERQQSTALWPPRGGAAVAGHTPAVQHVHGLTLHMIAGAMLIELYQGCPIYFAVQYRNAFAVKLLLEYSGIYH